ncbi:MAG: magnesium transporter [Chloroflexi bacterium]|nr:magnesium transporter [Chloroflexota bacterium]
MEPQARVAYQKIQDQLEAGDLPEAAGLLVAEHPADAADILMALEEAQRVTLLARLQRDEVAAIFHHLDSEDAADLAEHLGPVTVAEALDVTEPDVAADVLGDMETEQAAQVLGRMRQAQRVAPLLLHPEESAAGVMTPDYLALDAEMTVDETIRHLRQSKPPSDTIYYLFVVDVERRLQGVVSLRDLVVAAPETPLKEIMNPEVVSVRAGTDREEAAHLMRHYDLMALPVVDEAGHLLGMITFDDAADVLEEETTEDIYRMVGLSEEERALAPLGATLKRRMPWLLVNLFTAFVSAYVVSFFEPTISQMAALAVFMPVIAGHGGNTGTQAATLLVRGLALGEIGTGDIFRVLVEQLIFGVIHGLAAGAVSGLIALIVVGNPWLGLVVAVAMIGNVLLAGILGGLLPMLLRALRLDPALMSSIFLTTCTDIGGFIMLLGLGTLLLPNLLGR